MKRFTLTLLLLGVAARAEAQTLAPLPLDQVRYWAYQIQKVDSSGAVNALVSSRYDMVVLEPTRTDWSGGPNTFNTAGAVSRIKASKAHDGVHRKLAIAYIDIGEAEDWRWYWTWSKTWTDPRPADWPAYITAPDPDGWSGNYPVLFWDPAWKDILLYGTGHPVTASRNFVSVVDEVIKDGFDGVYLDWVEAFSDAKVAAAAREAGVDPAREMVNLIAEIRAYGRARNPGFVVIQQNAPRLLTGNPDLLASVDAIAQEAVWYLGAPDVGWKNTRGYDRVQDPFWTSELYTLLAAYQAAGKPVFDVEYAVKYSSQAYARSAARGYVPYCSRTALSQLTSTPPPGY